MNQGRGSQSENGQRRRKMNKNDCDRIGYILSYAKTREELFEELCRLDPRILEEYNGYENVQCHREGVMELYDKKMTERLGNSWCLKKAAKDITKQVYEEAVKEVYGEDFHSDLLKR
ncbi:MAG: hypothetical protein ABIC57_01410 [bacterium]